MLQRIKDITRPYRNAWHVLTHQGGDILRYIYRYVPAHKELFEPLKQFKGIHEGERCFIVATGPSLTIDDVNKLKGEICWTCNSGIKLFEKTDWRPDYYAIGDGTVFRRIEKDLANVNLKCAFYNHKDIEWGGEHIYPLPMWVSLVMDEATRRVIPRSWRKKRMSSDISKKVFMGGNVTNIIIQICFYMGFKEIYLLGCDCNYQGSSAHSSLTGYKNDDKLADTAYNIYQTMIDDHRCALKEAEKRGVKIYNATRGGMLEVYPRVNLDKALAAKR
jgi:hypothetical protein